MRSTIATFTCLVALTACGGGGGDPTGTGSTTSPPATTPATTPAGPPVALSGKVDDRGSTDLGTATTLQLDLGDFSFAPTYVKAAPGAKLTVTLSNSGKAPHTFTIGQPKVDVTVQTGGQGAASFAMPATGALAFYCRFHQAQGMQGAFYVTPGATAAAGSGDDGGAYNK